MTLTKLKVLNISVAMALLTVAFSCCDSENPMTAAASKSPTPVKQNTPHVRPQEIRRSDGGKTFMRTDGWEIPSLTGARREEFETSIVTSEGHNVKVHRTVINTDPLSLTADNPLFLIGMGSKAIRINKVKEYRTLAGVFCYKFLVNASDLDESTNETRSTGGPLYAYFLYDDDGDGIFESLIYDEKDRFGRSGFEGEPHLPKWAIDKDKKD